MRLRTTLHLASFFPIFTSTLFILHLYLVKLSVPGKVGIGTLPGNAAIAMAIFSLLTGWAFYRAGTRLAGQVGELGRMADRVKRGDIKSIGSPFGGKGEVAEAAGVLSELVVELRGYVDLISAHEKLRSELDETRAALERSRANAIPVSGAMELLRRAELGIVTRLLGAEHALVSSLPAGVLRAAFAAEGDGFGLLSLGDDAGQEVRLALRRIAAGPASAADEVSVKDAIEDAVALCRWKWGRERGGGMPVAVTISASAGAHDVRAERTGLVQLFAAVLVNAAEAMDGGGSVAVAIESESDGWVNVTVSDTGSGMSDAVRLRCVRPFFSTKEGHLGIGLTVAARLAARYGGRLGVIGEPGKGSAVHVSLPRYRQSERAVIPSSGRSRPHFKILLVEDDPAVRETLAAMLVSEKHSVTSAEDGAAAVLQLRRARFDVVITDRAMPIMTGDELAAVVKKRYPDTPVVMVTGVGEEMGRRGVQPEGVDIVLPKPVLREDMRIALATVSDRAEQGQGG